MSLIYCGDYHRDVNRPAFAFREAGTALQLSGEPSIRTKDSGDARSFVAMLTDLEAEKRAMQRIWAKRQSQIDRLTGSMTSIVGELQSIAHDHLTQLDNVLELEAIADS